MKIIVFRLCGGGYLGYKLLDDKAEILIEFLVSDVGPYVTTFKNFINNFDKEATSSNYSYLIKDGNDIWISCQFDDDPYENGLRMPQKELVSLLDQWDKLIKQDPQEIIVFKEGDSYRLEGHGLPDKR